MLTLLIYYLYIPNKLVERNIKSEHTLFLSISHTEFSEIQGWCTFDVYFNPISKIPKTNLRMTFLESGNRYLANNHWPTVLGYKSGANSQKSNRLWKPLWGKIT